MSLQRTGKRLVPDPTPTAKIPQLKTARSASKLADVKNAYWNAVPSPTRSRPVTPKTATRPETKSSTSPLISMPTRMPLTNLTIRPNKNETFRFQEPCTIRAVKSPIKGPVRHTRAGVKALRSPVPEISVKVKSPAKAQLWTPKVRRTSSQTSGRVEYLWNKEFRQKQHPDIGDALLDTPSRVTKSSGEKEQASRDLQNFDLSPLDTHATFSTPSKNPLSWLEREKWLAQWKEPSVGEAGINHCSTKPKFKLQRTRREICKSDPIPKTTPPHVESLRMRAWQFVEETLRKNNISPQRHVTAKAASISKNSQPREPNENKNLDGTIQNPNLMASRSSHPVKAAIMLGRSRFLAGEEVFDPFDEYFVMESAYLKALRTLSERKIWDHTSSALSNVPNDAELRQLFIFAHDEIRDRTASSRNVAPGVVEIVQQVEREQVFLRKCYESAGLQILAQLKETANEPMQQPPSGFASQMRENDSELTTTSCPSNHQVLKKRRSVKSVRWDPAIVETGPILKRSPSKNEVNDLTKETSDQNSCAIAHESEDITETIEDWRDLDGKTLEKLLKALREIKADDGDEMTETQDLHITNLNPCAPEFRPSCRWTERQANNALAHSGMPQRHEPIWIKTSESPADPRFNTAPPQPVVPKKVVIDDPTSHGREVDRFEGWYGELQMAEFVKKYPLTGQKRPDGLGYKLPKRWTRPALRDPAVTGPAAVVQRELEILLYESKERKALEAMRKRKGRCW